MDKLDFVGMRHYVGDKEVADYLDAEKINRLIGEIQLGFLPSAGIRFEKEDWLTVLTGSAPFRGVLALKLAVANEFEPIKHYELPDHLEGAAQYYTAQLGDVRLPLHVIEWQGNVPTVSKDNILDFYPQLYSMKMESGLLSQEKAAECMRKATEANKVLEGRKPGSRDVARIFTGFPGFRFFYGEGDVLPFSVKFMKNAYYADVLRERIHIR